MVSRGPSPVGSRPQSELLKYHAQTAREAVSSIMGIRQTVLSAVLFDAPPVSFPVVDEMVKEYRQVRKFISHNGQFSVMSLDGRHH